MLSRINSQHWNDENGNPAGGNTYGNGFAIGWQNGPLNRGADRLEPNGAFVEDIIAAAKDRLEYYQRSKFRSEFNQKAIEALGVALINLQSRTADREAREVEGTHEV